MGAWLYAMGSQPWNGHSGSLIANASANPANSSVLAVVPKGTLVIVGGGGTTPQIMDTFFEKAGGKALLCAKIERAEAIPALEEIVEASDAIMVARGDLAVEVGDAIVPALQKRMIRMAREKNKLVITATQMMESMIASPIPTRAEVSDVANAVLDGTDAVMLSAESAAGKYPVESIEAMDRICIEAEQTQPLTLEQEFLNRVFTRVDQSIAMAALFTAFHLKVKAIASLTESGSTALWMSRLNCGVPIYALTAQTSTRYRCTLFRDTYPLVVRQMPQDRDALLVEAENVLLANGVVKDGDLIVLTIGEPIGQAGGTNTMKIVRVGKKNRRNQRICKKLLLERLMKFGNLSQL